MKKIIFTLCFFVSLLFALEAKSIISSVCYGCHGDKMELSCYGVTQVVNKLESSYIQSSLLAYKNSRQNLYGFGDIMQSQIGGLSNKEIEKLSKYIPTLK